MKRNMLKILLAVVISHFSLEIVQAQSWKEMMDSTVHYQIKRDYNTALEWVRKALTEADKLYGRVDTNYASTLVKIAEFLYYTGKIDSAIYYQEIHLKLCRSLYPGDNADIETSLNNLSTYYKKAGRYSDAEPLYREVLAMSRRMYKGDNQSLAIIIYNTATFFSKISRYTEAESLFNEAIGMNRRLYKGDHEDLALSLNGLGGLYFSMGLYVEAEPLYKESLEISRRIYQNDNYFLAGFINNMAYFYHLSGRYGEAEPLYEEAFKIFKRLFKGNHEAISTLINNRAAFYKDQGRYNEAEILYKEGLEMSRQIYKGDHPNLIVSIDNLAVFYFERGNFFEAGIYVKEAYEMAHRFYKSDNPALATSITNMAVYTASLEKYVEAELLYREVLEMERRLYKEDHPSLARSNSNLALLLFKTGRYDEAERLLKESLEIRRRLYKHSHPDLIRILNNMALFLSRTKRDQEAQPIYIEELSLCEDFMFNVFPSLSEKEKEQFWNIFKDYFEQFNSFVTIGATDNNAIAQYAYNSGLITKGILLNSSQKVRNAILNSGNMELVRKYEEWKFQKSRIAKMNSQTESQLIVKRINLDSLIIEANKLEKELNILSESFSKGLTNKKYSWNNVKSNLKSSEAAAEIIRFRYHNSYHWTDTVYYAVIIVMDTSTAPELVILKYGNDLEGKYIEEYRTQAGQFKKRVYDPDRIDDKLKKLYSQFWAPIQEKLKGIKTVYLSPDGVYNLLNLNTLINPETGKYLLEELDLRLVTSTRDLVERNPINPPLQKGKIWNTAELFGDPQFDLDSTQYVQLASNCRTGTTREYYYLGNILDSTTRGAISTLPGTRKEIENIASSFQKQGWKVNRHLGPEALEEMLKAVDNPRVLHIATHGKFLKEMERRDDERMMGFETQRFVENPLLRSMLLFSGAENTLLNQGQQSSAQREDGLLTAYEAQNLNLDNTELVVLSACETGLGEVKNGEGVYGLQRAFQVAGAKSLIMSLWSVSDEATQVLMTSFYNKWLSGKTKRDAFREAQIELKQKYPGFYYWGAFVMVGE